MKREAERKEKREAKKLKKQIRKAAEREGNGGASNHVPALEITKAVED